MTLRRFQAWLPTAAGLLITGIFCMLLLSDHPLFKTLRDRMEFIAYDVRLNLWPRPEPKDKQVVIVSIDEKSLNELGRWPWPRRYLADLIGKVTEAGAAVVAFDMIFAEPQRNHAQSVIDAGRQLGLEINSAITSRLTSQFDDDKRLQQSLNQMDTVLGFIFHNIGKHETNVLPAASMIPVEALLENTPVRSIDNFTGNLPALQQAAQFGGFVTTQPDSDGVLRRSPLILMHDEKIYPSLALEASRLFYFLDRIEIHTEAVGDGRIIEGVKLGNVHIPTDQHGNMLVPYAGPSPQFPHIPATDVIHDRIDTAVLENAIVLVGTTALGLTDLVATPVQNVYPGVEVHANIIDAIVNRQFFYEPSWSLSANLSLLIVMGVMFSFLMPRLNAWVQLSAWGLVSVGLVVFTGWVWLQHGHALYVATPLSLMVVLSSYYLAYGFIRESMTKHRLKTMFGQYIPPERVEEMADSGEMYHFEGESRQMTVLFADIRNFTTLSESLDPPLLKAWLNQFFTHMTEIIFQHHGTIDKYVGDMIMAFWGAPVANPNHQRDAVNAAFAMLKKTEALKPEFQAKGLPEISIGIGINTGEMNVGDMGSVFRRSYTVLGDAVNLASRIEGLTKFYGANLVVGEQTREALGDFVCRKLDLVKVKGKAQAVTVYEPLCLRADASEAMFEELEMFESALSCYYNQQWRDAEKQLQQLAKDYAQTKIYSLYLERIHQLKHRDLGPAWDGVFERREK